MAFLLGKWLFPHQYLGRKNRKGRMREKAMKKCNPKFNLKRERERERWLEGKTNFMRPVKMEKLNEKEENNKFFFFFLYIWMFTWLDGWSGCWQQSQKQMPGSNYNRRLENLFPIQKSVFPFHFFFFVNGPFFRSLENLQAQKRFFFIIYAQNEAFHFSLLLYTIFFMLLLPPKAKHTQNNNNNNNGTRRKKSAHKKKHDTHTSVEI